MFYDQLVITLLLKKDIHYLSSSEVIGKWLNQALLLDDDLKVFHKQTGFKFYVYDNLFPFEKQGTYTGGKVYVLKIRSMKPGFIHRLKNLLRKVDYPFFHMLAAEEQKVCSKQILELYTVTPFFVTVDGKPWLSTDDFSLLEERLQANAEKKYKDLFGPVDFSPSFIQRIDILNRKPIAVDYKGIRLIGHKARLTINEDINSQKLAFTISGTGLAEKNSSLGGGFCLATTV